MPKSPKSQSTMPNSTTASCTMDLALDMTSGPSVSQDLGSSLPPISYAHQPSAKKASAKKASAKKASAKKSSAKKSSAKKASAKKASAKKASSKKASVKKVSTKKASTKKSSTKKSSTKKSSTKKAPAKKAPAKKAPAKKSPSRAKVIKTKHPRKRANISVSIPNACLEEAEKVMGRLNKKGVKVMGLRNAVEVKYSSLWSSAIALGMPRLIKHLKSADGRSETTETLCGEHMITPVIPQNTYKDASKVIDYINKKGLILRRPPSSDEEDRGSKGGGVAFKMSHLWRLAILVGLPLAEAHLKKNSDALTE